VSKRRSSSKPSRGRGPCPASRLEGGKRRIHDMIIKTL
jgi:hypothetical protein